MAAKARRTLKSRTEPGAVVTRIVLITVSSALFFGLAILGWGGFAAFFSHPALIALMIVFVALAGVGLMAGGNLSPGVREDRANRWVIPVLTILGLAAAYLSAYTDRRDFWTIDGDAVRWIGVMLCGAGRRSCASGRFLCWALVFSGLVAIQPGHRLVTTGIYRVIRHPSYVGPLVSSLGWGWFFVRGSVCCLDGVLVPPLIARIDRKSGCSVSISAPSTKPTAPGRRHASVSGEFKLKALQFDPRQMHCSRSAATSHAD